MNPTELLDHLWRHGVSAEDRDALAAAHAAMAAGAIDPAAALGLELFAGWLAADDGDASGGIDPGSVPDLASRVLARALALRAASRRRDVAAIDAGLAAIDHELAALDPADPRGATARAAVDLALAEAALLGADPSAARRCLTRVASGGPPAFRIAARQRQVSLHLADADLPSALTRARQALRLAEQLGRPAQAAQGQLLLGLVAYMMEDVDAMRDSLGPLTVGPDGATARILLAGLDPPELLLPMVSEALQVAAQRRDPLGYAIGALVGGRCCARSGRWVDALVSNTTARRQLRDVAPDLVIAIEGEIEGWRRAWGEETFRAAERDALAALERR